MKRAGILACVLLAKSANASDTLTLYSGPAAIQWTGDLLTYREGAHQIEFDAATQDNWTRDTIRSDGFEPFPFWTIDVMYNHLLHHIPEHCDVSITERLPVHQFDVVGYCRG